MRVAAPAHPLRPSTTPTPRRAGSGLAVALWLAVAPVASGETAAALPPDAALEAAGATIGEIRIVRQNVFDTSLRREDKSAFRAANRLHRLTREHAVRRLLLFAPGDPYSARLLAETARLLRAQPYLRDAEVRPVRHANGRVDIEVVTRDAWTFNPGISGGRAGGSSNYSLELEEGNLAGTGAAIAISHDSGSERRENELAYRHDHQFGDWRGVEARVRDNSDGSGWALALRTPFYELDQRRAWGVSADKLTLVESLYSRGEEVAEYRQRNDDLDAWWGWSAGLRGDRVRRYSVGLRDHRREFLPSLDPAMAGPLPEDRHLVGPWIGVESIRDEWAVLSNHDLIGLREDALLGLRWAARLGRADTALGGDRDAWWLEAEASRGFPLDAHSLLRLEANLDGRIEDGRARNARLGGRARYYRETGERRLFFATLEGSHGHELDLDGRPTLGGDNGLRGYPERWAGGESMARLSLEQRYFTDWYPGQLFRVGGAVFMDVGRTWGEDGLGTPNPGLMADVGVGLRLGNTRSSFARVIHVDLAFPLDGDRGLKDVELVIEARREF